MSHPIHEAPPIAAAVGRLHWHIDHITRDPETYTSAQLASLRGAAMELTKVTQGELSKRERL